MSFNHCVHLHHADQHLTVSQLQLLHMKGQRVEIIREIAARWHHFGDQLQFDSDSRQLKVIKARAIVKVPVRRCSSGG